MSTTEEYKQDSNIRRDLTPQSDEKISSEPKEAKSKRRHKYFQESQNTGETKSEEILTIDDDGNKKIKSVLS